MHETPRNGLIGDLKFSRRDFLRASGVGMATRLPRMRSASPPGSERSVILLLLVGGPSAHETFDPKPDATEDVRGPFGSIATRIPGVRLSEHLPGLAERMDRVALIRSVHHDGAPIHEVGLQLLQTGRLAEPGEEPPHFGSVVAHRDQRVGRSVRAPILLPGPIASTGVEISRGQSAGALGSTFEPIVPEARSLPTTSGRFSSAYGPTEFGRSCQLAKQLIEQGARVVTVNMYSTVFGRLSWDVHGGSPFSTFDDYARKILPTFDRAFSALLDDLERSGRLESTMVVAAGEIGRTPRINATGGRDHWPGAWSVVVAGGGVCGGQVIGATDPTGGEPIDRPVTLPEILGTMYHTLGIDDESLPPIRELLG